MIRRPPRSTRTDTLFPYTTLFRSYASYARGFKSGGFNGQASAPDETVGFDPEIADNFEIGAKLDLFDRRLRLNVAAFYVKFNDLQIAGVDPATDTILRSEERRVGKECVSTCRSRWSPDH